MNQLYSLKRYGIVFLLAISIIFSGLSFPIEKVEAVEGGCTDLATALLEITAANIWGVGETSASAFETGAIASVSKFLAVPIYDSLGVPANIALARIEGLNSTQEKIQESEIVFEAVKSTLKCLGGIVAKRLLDMIVDQTTDWIQNGGEPQFVTN